MKTFQQLLRRPLKSMMGLLLAVLATAVFVTCVGQYAAVVSFRQGMGEKYTTIALATEAAKESAKGAKFFDIDPALKEHLEELVTKRPDLVKELSQTELYTAYLPAVTPLNYTAYWDAAYNDWLTRGGPYSCAMLEVRLTGIGEDIEATSRSMGTAQGTFEQTTKVSLLCEGVVERVIALQEGFADPTGRRIELTFEVFEEAELEALGLRIGQRYLVYGMDYRDLDYELRSSVSVDQVNFEEPFSMDKVVDRGSFWIDPKGIKHPLYSYRNTAGAEERYETLSPDRLNWANACSLTVCDRSAFPLVAKDHDKAGAPIGWKVDPEHRFWYSSISEAISSKALNDMLEPVDAAGYIEQYHVPTIAALEGTAEAFLSDPAHADWQQALANMAINNYAFPLLAVDKLGYQGDFAREQVRIVEGRDFTSQELSKGEKVCILSQSLAAANGLSVGDEITLQSYSFDINLSPYEPASFLHLENLPDAAYYSPVKGFDSEQAPYRIVGLYRQENEWHNEESAYGFLPNTVFVPKASVSGEPYTCNKGLFLSIVLQNGKQKEFDQALVDAGFVNCFTYYDQGYSKIAGDLDAYQEVVSRTAYIGAAAFAAMLVLFLLLYPGSSGKTVRLMGALGAGRLQEVAHVTLSSLCLLAPGTVLGAVLGCALWDRLSAELMESAGAELTITADVSAIAAVLAAGLLRVDAILTVLTAVLVTGRNPMKRK